MAEVKAKVSFAGCVTMGAGDIKNITDENIVKGLVAAGYVEIVKSAKATGKKKGGDNED